MPRAAADAARRVLNESPDDADALYVLGCALDRLGEPSALEHLRRAADLCPDDPQVRHALGLVLYHLGLPDEALASLAFAETLGACLMSLSPPDLAEPYLARVVENRPDDLIARMNLAVALIDLNRCEDAIVACDRALAVDAAHTEVHMPRPIALLLAGRYAVVSLRPSSAPRGPGGLDRPPGSAACRIVGASVHVIEQRQIIDLVEGGIGHL